MFSGEPSQVLRAIGYFKDGDLPTLSKADQELLRNARDRVLELPDVRVRLAGRPARQMRRRAMSLGQPWETTFDTEARSLLQVNCAASVDV